MSVNVHTSKSAQETLALAVQFLCARIGQARNESRRVAVFLSGGSVIPGYHALAKYIEGLKNAEYITLLLADERWDADPNHAGSNARQIEEQTHLFSLAEACGACVIFPLQGESLEEDARIYNERVAEIFETHVCIGMFGVGADSHTAGILPLLSKRKKAKAYVGLRYLSGEYRERITLTPQAITRMQDGVVYAVGENKKEALQNLLQRREEEWPEYPAVLLRQIPELHIFTDQNIQKSV